MYTCPSCSRHLMNESDQCPFCNKPTLGFTNRIKIVGVSATAFVMAACYGVGPYKGINETGMYDTGDTGLLESDLDGDQVRADQDCDDLNPAINPKVSEICSDGLDNDCNNLIDEADPACK
jgi:hypothetical protein